MSTTRIVNIHEAKTHLSRLVEAVAEGESFVIAKAGRPLAKVVPIPANDADAPRRLGFLAGRLVVPADFNTIDPQSGEGGNGNRG